MTDKNQEFNTFFLSFVGQKCTFTINMSVSTPQSSVDFEEVPIFYEGILLDMDEEYYYLGNTPNEISQAVKINSVVHIMLTEEIDPYEQFLEDLPTPSKKEDIN